MIIAKDVVLNAMRQKNIATQTELANRLGMNKSQLSQMLSNNFCPVKTNVVKLMELLDINLENIIETKYSNGKPNNPNSFLQEAKVNYSQTRLFDNYKTRFDYRINAYEDVQTVKPNRAYNVVETFAGAGGLSLGLELAGLNLVASIELDKIACETLRMNRPGWNIIEDDINFIAETGIYNHPQFQFDKEIDVLSGGYPCQSFSYAGLKHGLNDIRGTLFYPFSQLLKQLQPKLFLAENVKGLVNHDQGKTLDTMIEVFEQSGYSVFWNVLNAWDYSVAQKRERIVIIGIRKDLIALEKHLFTLPKPHKYKPVLKDILKNIPKSEGAKYPKSKKKILAMVPPGGCWVDLPDEIAREYMGASYNSSGGRRGMARRLSWDEPSLTLTTSPQQKQTERCHPSETRPFTVREYARIQSFPDEWQFFGSIGNQYKQIGNAVPVNLAKAIGQSVVNYLNKNQL